MQTYTIQIDGRTVIEVKASAGLSDADVLQLAHMLAEAEARGARETQVPQRFIDART